MFASQGMAVVREPTLLKAEVLAADRRRKGPELVK